MRGKYKGVVLYRQIGQYNENINCMGGNGGGFTAVGFYYAESQSLRYSPGLGTVVTNDWCTTRPIPA